MKNRLLRAALTAVTGLSAGLLTLSPTVASPMASASADSVISEPTGFFTSSGSAMHTPDGEIASDESDHKPGTAGRTVPVPADLTMDTEAGRQMHPCAGRDLLYQAHVDATYITRSAGELTVMTVNGSEVVPSDSVCMRLAPDAVNGVDVSRMVVPDDPNLRFVGAPGRIVWRAPAERHDGWRPIWAGFGAFDPSHEWSVPQEFVGDSLRLELADFSGPGDMELFNYISGWSRANRTISSRDIRSAVVNVGGHAHSSWTFSEPGIYALTWIVSGMHFDGSIERSKPVTQYWLVGSDEEVGLPPGTTTGLKSIAVSAEQKRDSMGLVEPDQPLPETLPLAHQPPRTSTEEATQAVEKAGLGRNPGPIIAGGKTHASITFGPKDRWPNLTVIADDGSSYGKYPVVEVPDSTLTCLADDEYLGGFVHDSGSSWAWVTPAEGGVEAPSFGFSTRDADYSRMGPQKMSVAFYADGPKQSRLMVGLDSEEGFMPISDSGSSISRSFQMLDSAQYPVRYGFSRPGVYEVSIDYAAKLESSSAYDFTTFYFVVGNETINALRKTINPDASLLPLRSSFDCEHTLAGADPMNYPVRPVDPHESDEDPSPSPTPTPHPEPNPDPDPEPGTEPVPSPSPALKPTPDPTPDLEPDTPSDEARLDILLSLKRLWATHIPNHLVQRGHMDLAAGTIDGTVQTYVLDTENSSQEIRRESGSFAFAVPELARGQANAALIDRAPEFAQGVYALPQYQDERMPWVGFSTTDVDPASISDVMSVRLSGFDGPGRMISGHLDVSGQIDVVFDSAQLGTAVKFPVPMHDHHNFWFSQPGAYQVTFLYEWTTADRSVEESTLTAFFLVGDSAVTMGGKIIDSGKFPENEDETAPPSSQPEPGQQPAPGGEPTPAPDPEPIPSPEPGKNADSARPTTPEPSSPADKSPIDSSETPFDHSIGTDRQPASSGRQWQANEILSAGTPALTVPPLQLMSIDQANAARNSSSDNGSELDHNEISSADSIYTGSELGAPSSSVTATNPDLPGGAVGEAPQWLGLSGGWWSGFLLGVGGMSFMGGVALFVASIVKRCRG